MAKRRTINSRQNDERQQTDKYFRRILIPIFRNAMFNSPWAEPSDCPGLSIAAHCLQRLSLIRADQRDFLMPKE